MGLDRCFEAARAAELSIAGAPDWAPAHATRARALLNFGEVEGAVERTASWPKNRKLCVDRMLESPSA